MGDIRVLEVYLHERQVGTIAQLPGERNVFSFSADYIDDQRRPTISLSFKDRLGHLLTDIRPTRTKLPPFFSNLLPEGPLREFLAVQAGVHGEREYQLLEALGDDLPGALSVRRAARPAAYMAASAVTAAAAPAEGGTGVLHFSLAGVQLKFSALWDKGGKLTIPANGIGGAWIVKLPSPAYPFVPENEFVMMELARQVGIDVPETALVPLELVEGVPRGFSRAGAKAYAIRRFDRTATGQKVHMEDFAQIFGVYPEQKYKSASYRNIVEVISAEVGESGVVEFIRRFVFNALIGNGDMHLKNWSLIYPDGRNAALSPAYDFVTTIPYLPGDQLALKFVDARDFTSVTAHSFRLFAAKARLPESLVLDTVADTVRRFRDAWGAIDSYGLDERLLTPLQQHLRELPLYQSV